MLRALIIGIALLVLALIIAGVAAYLLRADEPPPPIIAQGSPTASPSIPPPPTLTPTPSATATPSNTPSPTATATLAERVTRATILMPDVTLPPSATPIPADLRILEEPPAPADSLPNATLIPAPYDDFSGWVTFESDHPAVTYPRGEWTPIGSQTASRGQYHYTEQRDAFATFTFTGQAVRVRYVGFTNGGVWNVLLNGLVVDTIDFTTVHFLEKG